MTTEQLYPKAKLYKAWLKKAIKGYACPPGGYWWYSERMQKGFCALGVIFRWNAKSKDTVATNRFFITSSGWDAFQAKAEFSEWIATYGDVLYEQLQSEIRGVKSPDSKAPGL